MVGVLYKVKTMFSNWISSSMLSSDRITASKALTSNQVALILGISDFANMDEYEIYEQIYALEAEIGGALDRMSTMAGDSIKTFCLRSVGKDSVNSTTLEPIIQASEAIKNEMIAQANLMMIDLEVREWAGALIEVMLMHGQVYSKEDPKDYSITIFPNKLVTILDDLKYKGGFSDPNHVISQANYLILNEGTEYEEVYEKSKFRVFKYKLTPLWCTDSKGRNTFGVFSVSPMHRCILPIWESRQLRIIDLLWRWKMIPREHHSFDSGQFSLENYSGSLDKRRTAARADAKIVLDAYAEDLKKQTPDIGHVTLDTTKIEIVENKTGGYMQTNDRMTQLVEQYFIALTTPRAVINGESPGSYAAMTVVSNYVALKVVSLANKVKPLLLDNVRKRLLAINPSYPVELLDMKISLVLANNKLDLFRQAAIMGALGLFTETEIREMLEYVPLTEEQRDEIVNTSKTEQTQVDSNIQSAADGQSPADGVSGTQGGQITSSSKPNYPDTPQSSGQHGTDPGKAVYQKTR
jgi:hypothetical protein